MIRFAGIAVLVCAVFAGLLFFTACSKKKNNNANPTATAVANAGDTTPTEAGPTSAASGDAGTQLEDLASRAQQHEVQITYDFTGGGLNGKMTLYSKPPDGWRVDLQTASGTFILITTGDASYVCTPDAGGSCLKSPSGASSVPVPFLDFLTTPGALTGLLGADLAGVSVDRSSETIAGEAATCFSVSGGATGTGSYCFADDGIMLRLSASSGAGEFRLKATSVERAVNDSDLEPPYTVQEVPAP